MGNRAVIATGTGVDHVGIYLHWGGGIESVLAFCQYCRARGYRPPDKDCYGLARMCQVIGNYFGGTASIGIDVVKRLDYKNSDNGMYVIHDWKIVAHYMWGGYSGKRQSVIRLSNFDTNHFRGMMVEINNAMPECEKLSLHQLTGAIREITGYPCRTDWNTITDWSDLYEKNS